MTSRRADTASPIPVAPGDGGATTARVVIAVLAVLVSACLAATAWFGVPRVLRSSMLSVLLDGTVSSGSAGLATATTASGGLTTRSVYSGDTPWGYYRDELSGDQLATYDALFESAMMDWTTVQISPVSFDDAQAAFEAFMDDHPEFFWINGWSYTSTADGLVIQVGLKWSMDVGTRDSYQARIDEVTDAYLASLDPAATTYDKVKAAYTYIISNTEYTAGDDDQDIVGVFLDGNALCAGYSRAFQYLLHLQGIPCAYVTGTAFNGDETSSHAWNLVVIDGVSTYVDCTWGDQGQTDDVQEVVYGELCITSDEISRTHTFDHPELLPACTDTTYDYYRLAGGYFESYDHDAVIGYLIDSVLAGQTDTGVKFGSAEAYAAACADLFDNSALSYALGQCVPTGMQYHYSMDDSLYIIAIRWT